MILLLFIIACIVLLVGVVALFIKEARPIGVVLSFIAVLVIIATCATTVAAKNIGVKTSFGAVAADTLSPGFHWKAPWAKVTELDGTVQTDEYAGDNGCIYVRIGDGSRGCVTLTNRWSIVPERANTIFGDYRSDDPTDSLRTAVVSTQLKAAVQDVMSDYNPIANLKVVTGKKAADLNFAPDYDAVSKQLETNMAERLGDEPLVDIRSITVSYVSVAASTQDKIDAFIAEVGATRVAAQSYAKNVEIARANKALSASISKDPALLTSKCLDGVNDAIEKGYNLPAGYSCFAQGSGVGVLAR